MKTEPLPVPPLAPFANMTTPFLASLLYQTKTHLVVIAASVALSGCAMFEGKEEAPFLRPNLSKPLKEGASGNGGNLPAPVGNERSTGYYQTPKPPAASRSTAGSLPPPTSQPIADDVTAAVNLENMPIPQFANAVFGAILKKNVSIDPQVQQRTDMVSLRTGKPQTGDQLFRAAQAVLRSYGVTVTEFQGLIRVLPDKSESGYLPEIRRGRAQPEVPGGLRPVFYLAELEHITAANAAPWIRNLFGARVTVQDDGPRNALLLSGQSDSLSAAMEALQLLDQPLLRGRTSARITPVFWSADEMAKRLVDLLTAEGYAPALNAAANTPIIILPIAPANSIVVFAANENILNHTLRWAKELDQKPESRSGGFITYQVKNANASDLAKTLQEVFGGSAAVPATAAGVASNSPQASSSSGNKKVVVNPASNSLIIQTTPTEYQQWHGLLQELDKPAKSALIMATVAEVRLTDTEQFGFQWLLNQFRLNGQLINIGSTSSITLPSSGPRLSVSSISGSPKALLTLLASSNKIRILSNPSVVARNGEAATIQVGQEVPILTSQISNANTGGTTGTGILQTIQYRNTGVILKVKPVIHSGGKLDLDVAQEVSAAQVNETGVNTTPVILTRKIDTKLTVTDGNTMLLGGLISENRTVGHSGIPLLKDIPIAGALFRTSASSNVERTELVVMLTPYVMEDDFESQAMTETFRNQFSWAQTVSSTPMSDPKEGRLSASVTNQQAESPKTEIPQTYRSRPYELPEFDILQRSDSLSEHPPVVSKQHTPFGQTNLPPPLTASTGAASGNSQPGTPPVPTGSNELLNESLREELMRTIRGGQ